MKPIDTTQHALPLRSYTLYIKSEIVERNLFLTDAISKLAANFSMTNHINLVFALEPHDDPNCYSIVIFFTGSYNYSSRDSGHYLSQTVERDPNYPDVLYC